MAAVQGGRDGRLLAAHLRAARPARAARAALRRAARAARGGAARRARRLRAAAALTPRHEPRTLITLHTK